jgi:hypothetical protein
LLFWHVALPIKLMHTLLAERLVWQGVAGGGQGYWRKASCQGAEKGSDSAGKGWSVAQNQARCLACLALALALATHLAGLALLSLLISSISCIGIHSRLFSAVVLALSPIWNHRR